MERGSRIFPNIGLWVAFPLIVGVGAFAKENAILACPARVANPDALLLFFAGENASSLGNRILHLIVAVPCVVAAAWLVTHPTFITGSYQIRPFTLSERLLTEPRVLWSYVKAMLFPVGKDMWTAVPRYVCPCRPVLFHPGLLPSPSLDG